MHLFFGATPSFFLIVFFYFLLNEKSPLRVGDGLTLSISVSSACVHWRGIYNLVEARKEQHSTFHSKCIFTLFKYAATVSGLWHHKKLKLKAPGQFLPSIDA
jgi:hypothetical protein